MKKIYLGSSNFFSVFHSYDDFEARSRYLGCLAENHLFNLLRRRFSYVSFYRVRENEFDFLATNDVLDRKKYRYFESKYGNETDPRKFSFIRKKAAEGSAYYEIASKDEFDLRDDHAVIPIWLWK